MKKFITITEACKLLSLSRPTFNARRSEFQFKEFRQKRNIQFLRSELLEKIYRTTPPTVQNINLTIHSVHDELSSLFIDSFSLDLRRLNQVDGFGLLALLARIRSLVDTEDYAHLLLPDTAFVTFLEQMGFFREIRRYYKTQVEWNEDLLAKWTRTEKTKDVAITHYVGFKGQERGFSEEIQRALQHQGFSEELSAYILWVLGELADNAHTHAKGPCYFNIDRYQNETKYLQVSIVDSGVGIETSLRGNPKHQNLTESSAILTAFQSKVSSWPDEAQRGKGLSDVLKIAIGNQGLLRVESNQHAFMMSFGNFKPEIQSIEPLTRHPGTRISLVLIDSSFELPERQAVDAVIEHAIQGLKK